MNKFKIGDRVRLKSYLKENTQYGGITFTPKMIFSGYKRIIEITSAGNYVLQNGGGFCYSEKMLCPDIEYITSKDQTKYKVGDRVIMRPDLKNGEPYGGITYINDMYHPIVTIKTIALGNNVYTVEEADLDWLYSSEMFIGLVDEADKKCTKFNVGDKVVLKKGLIVNHFYGGFAFVKEMEFKGVRTIQEIPSDEIFRTSYLLKEDKVGYCYTAEMFEPYKEESTLSFDDYIIKGISTSNISGADVSCRVEPIKEVTLESLQESFEAIRSNYERMKAYNNYYKPLNNTSTTDTNTSVALKIHKNKKKVIFNFNNNGV